MLSSPLFTILGLALAASTPQHERLPQLATSFASAPRTCAVLQAAYTVASRQTRLSYPKDVRTDTRILQMQKSDPDFRSGLALSPQEKDELADQGSRYDFPNFKPSCKWNGLFTMQHTTTAMAPS